MFHKGGAGAALILTGPPGSGKSTMARLLAENSPRAAVHLHTDDFYTSIRSGFVAPYLPEAHRQNEVVVGVIADAAMGYARGGYDVIVDGIVGPWFLDPFRKVSRASGIALDYVVLRPGRVVSLARAKARTTEALKEEDAILGLCEAFTDLGELERHCIDSASQTAAETAATVREGRETGRFRLS